MAALDGISTQGQILGSLGPSGNVNSTSSVQESAVASADKSSTPTVAIAAPDTTNVSSTAGLVAAALNTPDVRLDKVAALQSSIADGSYNVSSAQVASKIVDSLLK